MRRRTGRAVRVGNDSDYGASSSNAGFGAPDKPTPRAERPKDRRLLAAARIAGDLGMDRGLGAVSDTVEFWGTAKRVPLHRWV